MTEADGVGQALRNQGPRCSGSRSLHSVDFGIFAQANPVDVELSDWCEAAAPGQSADEVARIAGGESAENRFTRQPGYWPGVFGGEP